MPQIIKLGRKINLYPMGKVQVQPAKASMQGKVCWGRVGHILVAIASRNIRGRQYCLKILWLF
jgi:hypothetical protein